MQRAAILSLGLSLAACFAPTRSPLPAAPPNAKTMLLVGDADANGAHDVVFVELPLTKGLGISSVDDGVHALFYGCPLEVMGFDAASPLAPLPPTFAAAKLTGDSWVPLRAEGAMNLTLQVRLPRNVDDGCKDLAVSADVVQPLTTSANSSVELGTWLDPSTRTIVAGDDDGCLHLSTPNTDVDVHGRRLPTVFRALPCDEISADNLKYDPVTDKAWGLGRRRPNGERVVFSLDHQGRMTIESAGGGPELAPIWIYRRRGAISFAQPGSPFEMYAMSAFADVGRFDGHTWGLVARGQSVSVDGDLTWTAPGEVIVAGLCDRLEAEPFTGRLGCSGQITHLTSTGTVPHVAIEVLPAAGNIDALVTAPNHTVYAGTKNGKLLVGKPETDWITRSIGGEGIERLEIYGDEVIAALDDGLVHRIKDDGVLCDPVETNHEVRGLATFETSVVLIGEPKSGKHLAATWLEPFDRECRLVALEAPNSRD